MGIHFSAFDLSAILKGTCARLNPLPSSPCSPSVSSSVSWPSTELHVLFYDYFAFWSLQKSQPAKLLASSNVVKRSSGKLDGRSVKRLMVICLFCAQ
jgi:hypothetical protein